MNACTRAPHARWSTCTCPPCRATRNRLQKQRRTGRFVPARSDLAWATVDAKLAAGWTPTAIATAAGIPTRAVQSALHARATRGKNTWSAVYAERLITAGEPTAGYIPVLGARRRLQALACLGWSIYAIEQQMVDPVRASTLFAIRSGLTETRITPAIDRAIRGVYDDLNMRPAPDGQGARQARQKAKREGWHAPLAWDDDTIDDPNAQPDHGGTDTDIDPVVVERLTTGRPTPHTRAEKLAAIERMHKAGHSPSHIARTLHAAHSQVARDLRKLGLLTESGAA